MLRRQRLIPAILLAAQFLFSAHPSPAQSPTPSSSCPCTLQGSVVDSISGQPVPHALVKLSATSPRAALTDSEGKFQFEALPAGPVTLEAVKPGFLGNNSFGSWSGTVSSFQIGPDAAPALLKLLPESVIAGQVSAESGEPLEGFTVSVLFRSPRDRRFYQDPRPSVVTDDEGKFRIAGLRPGSYFLEVRQTQPPALHANPESSVPSGYAPVFYPGARDTASAVPLRALPGKTLQANFSLKREPFIRLSGTVSGYHPQEQVVLMLWDSSDTPQNPEISFDPATGAFQTKWIPPGTYMLTAQSTGSISVNGSSVDSAQRLSVVIGGLRRASGATFASLRVNASSNLSGLHLTLQPTTDIPVVFHGLPANDSEGLPSPPFFTVLVSNEGSFPGSTHLVSLANEGDPPVSGNALMFRGLTPGAYRLLIGPKPNVSYYAESATWGSTDLLRDDLVLDASGAVHPIEVVVRDDGATLNGTVFCEGPPPPFQVVLLTDKRKNPILLPGDVNGRFEVSGLAPGTYRVFAVDASSYFDYEDPAFLAKISSKIQEITLSPKQSASINLELATVEK